LTPSGQLRQRILELNSAMEKGAISDEQRARALGAFTRAQDAASTATRTRLGIVTEEELLATRMRELDDLQSKGFIPNAEERAQAEALARREVEESNKALQVRASLTPALTRLALDSQDFARTLNQELAGAMRSSTATMLDMLKGTKSLSAGFDELAS